MPYKSISELPKYVKKYSGKIQRQFMHVFNSVFDKTKSEARAFKAGNSVLKNRFKDGQNVEKNSHSDYFKMLIDSFLDNLNG